MYTEKLQGNTSRKKHGGFPCCIDACREIFLIKHEKIHKNFYKTSMQRAKFSKLRRILRNFIKHVEEL